MAIQKEARPFVRWAGGKTQLLPALLDRIPKKFKHYYEPFVGGGALYFWLAPNKATILDINRELIITYKMIQDNVEKLIRKLADFENSGKEYYKIRAVSPLELSGVDLAARFIYLNKLCYNGLYRVNKKGEFNVPIGRNKNVMICDESNLRLINKQLFGTNILEGSYLKVLELARAGDFIYFDPPYYPFNESKGFTSYTVDGFSAFDHRALYEVALELDRRGCFVMLSNSDTKFINDLYKKKFTVEKVQVKWIINCVGKKRTKINELIIRNY